MEIKTMDKKDEQSAGSKLLNILLPCTVIIMAIALVITFFTAKEQSKIIWDYKAAHDDLLVKYQEMGTKYQQSSVDYFLINNKQFIIINKDFVLANHKEEKIVAIKYMLTINEKEEYIIKPIAEGYNHLVFQCPEIKTGGQYKIKIVTTKGEFYPGS